MKNKRIFILNWLPLFLYCALIFVQSSMPPPQTVPDIFLLDKILHFFGYALLGVLFFRAYNTLPLKNRPRLTAFLSAVSATLYGLSDEIHQHFVPNRTADVGDFTADMLGSIIGVLIFHQVLSRRLKYGNSALTKNRTYYN